NNRCIGNKLARKLEIAADKPRGWLDLLHNNNERCRLMTPEQDLLYLKFDKVLEWHSGKMAMANKQANAGTQPRQLEKPQNAFYIEVTGDSMVSMVDISLSICPGDIATVDCDLTPVIGDIVLVKIKQSVKMRQLIEDGNEQILKAFNPQYPIIPFTNHTKILGVVVEIRRQMRHKNS